MRHAGLHVSPRLLHHAAPRGVTKRSEVECSGDVAMWWSGGDVMVRCEGREW